MAKKRVSKKLILSAPIHDKYVSSIIPKERKEDAMFTSKKLSRPNKHGIDLLPIIRFIIIPQHTNQDGLLTHDHFQMLIGHDETPGHQKGNNKENHFNRSKNNTYRAWNARTKTERRKIT